jgi:hypothetical protein
MTIAGFVLAALGYASDPRAGWIIALIVGGQALSLASMSFAADERLGGAAGTGSVGARRQHLGFALLIAHIGLYVVVWFAAVLSYARATASDPLPSVFGLSFEQQGPAFVWGVIAAELCFAAAVYALGPAWRQRLKQLFRYQPSSAPVVAEAPSTPPSFRYRLGLAVFVVGNLLAVMGLLLPLLGLAKGPMVGVVAVMLGAGEVISLASIFFLGKEGFKELKSKLFGLFKRVPSGEPISRRRHRVGCTLLALNVLLQFAALVFPIASHYGVASDGTFPEVLGLGRGEQLQWFVGILAAAEVLFFAGVYALGADWWARFQAIFETRPDPAPEPLIPAGA